jgi:hydrophobic/amphiphilic exporter-1 (mainly G- bacteria), HAE1 family
MSISQKTLEHPVLVLIVFVLLGIMGVFVIGKISLSLFPDTDNPYVMVSTTYENAGPEAVEKTVTEVLESGLVSVSGLKEIDSTSSEGSSMISLEFDYGSDLEAVVNDIRDKLDRVKGSLPDDADSPRIFKMDASSMPIMRIAVRGNRSSNELREIAEDDIEDLLEQAEGVAEASVSGGLSKIVRVELSENRLAAYGITMTTIYSALAKQNLELSGGKVTEGKKDYEIRTTGEFSSIDQINNVVIATVNGYDVRLRDVGTAAWGYEDPSSVVYINGEQGVYVSVTKQSGANSVSVADAMYKKIAEVQKTLPQGITLEIVSDDTTSIRDTLSTLFSSIWQGLLLAVIILFIFLQNFRSTFIISVSIPLSLIITVLCMYFAGITLNMMTLTGLILGVGMIVDASIVMIENMNVYRSRGAKPRIAAILGSQEMMMSVVSGNLTTICVFVPFLFYIKDLEMMGQMFKGIIFTIVIAIASSLFVSIFLVPVLAGKFVPLPNRNEKPVKNPFLKKMYSLFQKVIDGLTNAYRKGLSSALNHRAVVVVVCCSLLVMSIALIPTLRINMMGSGRGGDTTVTLNVTMPTGTTLSETTSVLTQLETIVRSEIKGYKNIITSVGTGGNHRSTSSTYKGSIAVSLPDAAEQIDDSTAVQEKLRAHFKDFADAQFSFDDDWSHQISGSDLVIKVHSNDLDTALSAAGKIQSVMGKISDIGEVTIDTTKGLPEVQVVIDRQRAYAFGVDVTTAAKEIYYAMNGATCTEFRSNGEEYDVDIMYRPEDRAKMTDLASIYVEGTDGLVSVANFASFKKGLGPVSINHVNRIRTVEVSADIVSTKNANLVENEIKEGISNTFVVPEGVTISYEGAWSTMQKQYKIYGLIIIMALLLVFGVMAATYESFKAPVINMMTIPFLIIGVVLMYKITRQAMSITSMVGIIMLVGIVVNNGIILVDYTGLLISRGKKMKEACLEAGTSRLRPVLMTTLTTILGTLPMCFQTEGSAAMVQPIGLTIVGGLTSSTFVTLFFIPVLYSLIMKEKSQSENEIPVEIAELASNAGVPAKREEVKVEIIANKSVQENIIDMLEQVIPGVQYTIVPTVMGRGGDNYKLGTTTWPEQNFLMLAYMSKENLSMVQAVIEILKRKFPKEGIKLFLMEN